MSNLIWEFRFFHGTSSVSLEARRPRLGPVGRVAEVTAHNCTEEQDNLEKEP